MGLPGQRVQISNKLSKRLVHQWRSEEAAIMVGTNTALTDNPELNVRYVSGRSPIRILLDKHLKTPLSHHLFDGKQQTLVFTSKENVPDITETTFIPHNFRKITAHVFGCAFPSLPRNLSTSSSTIWPQICVHVRGERVHVSWRGGRGLRFSLCRCSPSHLFSPFFAVPFSAEHPRSFRNASSNVCAKKPKSTRKNRYVREKYKRT